MFQCRPPRIISVLLLNLNYIVKFNGREILLPQVSMKIYGQWCILMVINKIFI